MDQFHYLRRRRALKRKRQCPRWPLQSDLTNGPRREIAVNRCARILIKLLLVLPSVPFRVVAGVPTLLSVSTFRGPMCHLDAEGRRLQIERLSASDSIKQRSFVFSKTRR